MCIVISSELAACPSHWKLRSLIKHLCTTIVIEVKDIVSDFQGLATTESQNLLKT